VPSAISNDAARPDAGAAPETMTLEAVQRELGQYRPGTAAEVMAIEAYMARRARLWRRLDTLTRPGVVAS